MKRRIRITESELVNLIDRIIKEVIDEKIYLAESKSRRLKKTKLNEISDDLLIRAGHIAGSLGYGGQNKKFFDALVDRYSSIQLKIYGFTAITDRLDENTFYLTSIVPFYKNSDIDHYRLDFVGLRNDFSFSLIYFYDDDRLIFNNKETNLIVDRMTANVLSKILTKLNPYTKYRYVNEFKIIGKHI